MAERPPADVNPIIAEMLTREHPPQRNLSLISADSESLAPFGAAGKAAAKITDLKESVTRSYDLTVSAAFDLQIPVVGSGSGGFNRRVVVLERAAFNRIAPKNETDSEKQVGYAIRLCVTVNRMDANFKISLPFLAASAQLGSIEAQWVLQVIGLAGKTIDQALVPPTELNVETFVIAKQSLERIIGAIDSRDTLFEPKLIAEVRGINQVNHELRSAVARAYALTSLERGRTLQEAYERLGEDDDANFMDSVRAVYEEIGGIASPDQKPGQTARRKAGELCGRIRADIPIFG